MSKLRVGDIVRLQYGGLGQIVKEHPNGYLSVEGFNCASEIHSPDFVKLYIPKELEERIAKIEKHLGL